LVQGTLLVKKPWGEKGPQVQRKGSSKRVRKKAKEEEEVTKAINKQNRKGGRVGLPEWTGGGMGGESTNQKAGAKKKRTVRGGSTRETRGKNGKGWGGKFGGRTGLWGRTSIGNSDEKKKENQEGGGVQKKKNLREKNMSVQIIQNKGSGKRKGQHRGTRVWINDK